MFNTDCSYSLLWPSLSTWILRAILSSPMTRVDLPLPLLPQMATFCRGGMLRLRPPELGHTLEKRLCSFLGLGECLKQQVLVK